MTAALANPATAYSIRTEPAACCLCSGEGERAYSDLRDDLFHAPGTWSLRYCRKDELMWLSPRPITADLAHAYANYYTHQQYQKSRFSEWLRLGLANAVSHGSMPLSAPARALFHALSFVPALYEQGRGASRALRVLRGAALLDVGCGDGRFVGLARQLGWDAQGVDPDPLSSARARAAGLRVRTSTLDSAGFSAGQFDAITMHHIVEHLTDPLRTLREARRVLKEDGQLIVFTPNIASIQHNAFRENWRDLDPPRHLYIFSERSLRSLLHAAGFEVQSLASTHRWALQIARQSARLNRGGGAARRTRLGQMLRAMFMQCSAHPQHQGDELVAIARVRRP